MALCELQRVMATICHRCEFEIIEKDFELTAFERVNTNPGSMHVMIARRTPQVIVVVDLVCVMIY